MNTPISLDVGDLTERIRSAIAGSEEPDAEAIANTLQADLAGPDLEAAVHRGLALLVERAARQMKASAIRRAREDAQRATYVERHQAERQEAQEALALATVEHQQLVEERFFAIWTETPTGRKFLGECTIEDLRYSRDRQNRRSEDLLRASARDERLARALEASGRATVREMGYETAAAAFLESD